jgi:hypothetical protein
MKVGVETGERYQELAIEVVVNNIRDIMRSNCLNKLHESRVAQPVRYGKITI